MGVMVRRVAMAGALVGLGWTVGRAQAGTWDFEFVVDAPVGKTTITCTRGCEIAWAGRMVPDKGEVTFSYGCSGQADRCLSGAIAGWVIGR